MTTDRPAHEPRVPTVGRRAATLTAAVAQAALPALILPRIRRDLLPPDVIHPAPYTFVVWLPIYAASPAYASMFANRRPDRPRTALALTTLTAIGAVGATATGATSGTSATTTRTYAATVLWALAGIVIGQRQESPFTAAAAVAAVPVAAAAVIRTGIGADPSIRPSRRPLTERGS